jgi:hypothetical protein
MSELFREIEEDIRRERFEKLWRSVGRFAVWGSVAIVVATAVFVAWDNHAQNQAEEKTSQLLKAGERMNASDYKGAISIFSALTDDNTSTYYTIAMLQKAEAQESSGDAEGAKKTYAALAKSNSEFSALAKLKSDEKNDVIEISVDSAFYHTASEQNAWRLLHAGKKAEAANIFVSLLNDENSPRSLVSRAREVLRVIAPEKLAEKSIEKKVVNE